MKNILFPLIALVALSGCVKKPTACVEADKTTILIGESVKFTNCSEDYVEATMTFGEGPTASSTDPFEYIYENTGTYVAELTAWSKKNRKYDAATITITVVEPEEDDFFGSWHYYKVEEWDILSGPTLTNTWEAEAIWLFTPDTCYQDGFPVLWSVNTAGSEMTVGGTLYNIVKLIGNEMVLMEGTMFTEYRHYFEKQ